MAWNEPGNDKDPWGNKGKKDKQGPPDLDDLFKDLGRKFKGTKGKANSKDGGSSSNLGIILAVIIATLVYAYSCVYTVKEAERGIVLRFGQYAEQVDPGLRWKWTLIEKVILVDIQTTRDLYASGFMLTQDENVVGVEMQVQYRVVNARNYKFSATNADDSLSQALDSALRYVIGHSKMDDILTTGKEKIRQNVWQELEKIIEIYNLGLMIVDVNFKDARPPEAVKSAFDDAIAAQEDEVRYIREAEAYERGLEPRARGQVKRLEQEAIAYKQQTVLDSQGAVARFNKLLPEYKAAPEVTRQRLYITTLEKVYANTNKVMVDVEGGNNMIYLPLDKLMQSSPQTPININSLPSRSTSNVGVRQNTSATAGRGDRFNSGRN